MGRDSSQREQGMRALGSTGAPDRELRCTTAETAVGGGTAATTRPVLLLAASGRVPLLWLAAAAPVSASPWTSGRVAAAAAGSVLASVPLVVPTTCGPLPLPASSSTILRYTMPGSLLP